MQSLYAQDKNPESNKFICKTQPTPCTRKKYFLITMADGGSGVWELTISIFFCKVIQSL